MKISGPRKVCFYNISFPILFIGEKHSAKAINNHKPIYQWLYDVSKNSSEHLIFYMEEDISQEYKFLPSDTIDSLYNNEEKLDDFKATRYLFDFLEQNNSNEFFEYKKIDSRSVPYIIKMSDKIYLIRHPMKSFLDHLDDITSLENVNLFLKNKNKTKLLFKYISGIDKNEKSKENFNKFLMIIEEDYPKFRYEVDYMKLFFEITDELYKNMDEDFDKEIFFESLYKTIDEDTLIMVTLFNFSMDIYFLLNYLQNKNKKSIVYTGETHINTYVKFFEYYFELEPDYIYEGKKDTIKIPENILEKFL